MSDRDAKRNNHNTRGHTEHRNGTQQTIITSQVTLNNKQGSLINIEYNIPETSIEIIQQAKRTHSIAYIIYRININIKYILRYI